MKGTFSDLHLGEESDLHLGEDSDLQLGEEDDTKEREKRFLQLTCYKAKISQFLGEKGNNDDHV